MEYYGCRNCGWYFTKEEHKLPGCCPNCKEPFYMQEIDKTMYDEWLDIYKYSYIYSEWQQDKYFDTMWKMCNMVWDNYDSKHKSGSI
jgi:hypothetical protein